VLNIVKPENAKGIRRFYVFMGRLGARRFPTHQRMVRDLVVEPAAVFVNHTRSPEAHYPVAINQAYNATKWVAEYGNEIELMEND
jgi:acetyl esterase/lipase